MQKNSILLRQIFANNVRNFRKEKGLSQESLADLCNIHRTYIGSIERAERNVSIDNMEKIANALEVNIKELLK